MLASVAGPEFEVDAVLVEYVPLLQDTHSEVPCCSLYLPFTHAVHVEIPVYPGSQTHDVLTPFTVFVCSGHPLHSALPDKE